MQVGMCLVPVEVYLKVFPSIYSCQVLAAFGFSEPWTSDTAHGLMDFMVIWPVFWILNKQLENFFLGYGIGLMAQV